MNNNNDFIVGEEDEDILENSKDLFEHHKFIVDKGQTLLRVDKFLTMHVQNATRNKIQNSIDLGYVLANNNIIKANYRVKPDDVITVSFPYERRPSEIIPEDIPLDIVYEDNDVLVINKQAGLVVHPGHGNFTGTLVNGLAYYFNKTGVKYDENNERGGMLVHRLDKDTSGLLLIAKNELSHIKLAKQFFDRTTHRKYTALVWGGFEEPEGTIVGNIGRSPHDKLKMKVFKEEDELGKYAITHYKVIQDISYISLVECKLGTGRTHQIRVHMEHIGHPLFNDYRYGGDKILKGVNFSKYTQFVENCFKILPRQALHASELGFTHPTTGEEMIFKSELPSDITTVLERWRAYISNRAGGATN